MRHVPGLSFLGWAAFACTVHAQVPPTPSTQTFRTGVELVLLDVSVLDEQRRPVRGLTPGDFSVLVDGVVRPIVSFSAAELPPPPKNPPSHASMLRPDITTNEMPNGRLVVILLDQSTRLGTPAVRARELAKAAVHALAPGDLAAVIHTNQGPPQNLTDDRARLLAAIDGGALGMNPPEDDIGRGECGCGICSLDAITIVADALRDAPERPKSLLFIGEGIALDGYVQPVCRSEVKVASERMLRATQAAHLTVHTLDPNGLQTTSVSADVVVKSSANAAQLEKQNRASLGLRHDSLRELAALTGGRPVLNTNAATDHIASILGEASVYYVIGFEAPRSDDSRFKPITVRVARPDAHVHTRKGYYPAAAASDVKTAGSPGADGLEDIVKRVLPDNTLPLTLAPLPLGASAGNGATVLLPLGVRAAPPALEPASSTPTGPETERIEVFAAAFDRHGRNAEWTRHRFELTAPARPPGELQYEVVPSLNLPPGAYEVRVAVRHERGGGTGTVYAFVDVPDFENDPVTLSGLLLWDPAAPSATPVDMLGNLLQHPPTTRRAFAEHDSVAAFVRVYQGRKMAPESVTIAWRIRDHAGESVAERIEEVPASRFESDAFAETTFNLPLGAIGPGTYVLLVEAARGGTTAVRQLVFSVK
jgi:VWFA-related protein